MRRRELWQQSSHSVVEIPSETDLVNTNSMTCNNLRRSLTSRCSPKPSCPARVRGSAASPRTRTRRRLCRKACARALSGGGSSAMPCDARRP
eukprot:4423450-Pleurochrysis_carterae.AAC.2